MDLQFGIYAAGALLSASMCFTSARLMARSRLGTSVRGIFTNLYEHSIFASHISYSPRCYFARPHQLLPEQQQNSDLNTSNAVINDIQSLSSSADTRENDDDCVAHSKQNQKKKEIVVVMIGWLGCRSRHLLKYSQWYNACNSDTVSIIPSPFTIFSSKMARNHSRNLLRKIKEIVDQKQQEQNVQTHLVFQMFSGNGANFYSEVVREMADDPEFYKLKDSVCGLIWDSAPPEIDATTFTNGFFTAFSRLKHDAEHILHHHHHHHHHHAPHLNNGNGSSTDSVYANKPFLWIWMHHIFSYFLGIRHVIEYYDQKRFTTFVLQPKCPQLYLYSDADTVVTPSQIQQYISFQKNVIDIHEVNFFDSRHCQHFRKHPHEYSRAILDFLRVVHDFADTRQWWVQSRQFNPTGAP